MGPVIGNGIHRRLLRDWGVWARLHRAPPFSPRPATSVSEVNCHGKIIEEATSAAFTCKQRPPHVSCHVGGIGSADIGHPPSTIKSIYTVTLVTWPATTLGLGCSQTPRSVSL